MKTFLAVLLMLAGGAQEEGAGRTLKKRSDYEGLVERNIFAPPGFQARGKWTVEAAKKTTLAPAPTARAPKPWIITGIYLDAAEEAHKVIVEREGTETPRSRTLKAGEEYEGGKIGEIGPAKVIVLFGGEKVERAVGEALPMPEPEPSAAGPEAGETAPAEAPEGVREAPPERDHSDVLQRLRNRFKKKPLPEPADN